MTTNDFRTRKNWPTGERHHQSKLTNEQVRAIRARHFPYIVGYGAIAKEFGVATSTVKDICTFRTWKHVR